MKILGLIPARGGSKGLPGKNVKALGGVSLLERAIRAARASKSLDRIWVSTDDPAIAAAARRAGVPVPWLRPPALSTDSAAVAEAAAHLLERLDRDEGYRPDAVMLLQPTSPFRSARTIRQAAALFKRHGDGVVAVTPAPSHPFWCCRVEPKTGRLKPFLSRVKTPPRRQDLPAAYALAGTIYVASRGTLLKRRSFRGPGDRALIVSAEEAVDIDTPLDWAFAEAVLRLRRR